jgi:hypothetical protein
MEIEDAKKYEGYGEDEVKIARFLEEKSKAYTEDEIREGIGKTPMVYNKDQKGSYWTWENAGKFALEVSRNVLFGITLDEMVKKGKIKVSEVAGTKYYFVEKRGSVFFTGHEEHF